MRFVEEDHRSWMMVISRFSLTGQEELNISEAATLTRKVTDSNIF